MKICYLSDINSAHTHKWLKYFIAKGYDVHVISLGDGEYDGATVHSLDISDELMKNTSEQGKLQYFKKIKKVKEIVNEIKPDILHAHYATSYGLLGAVTNFHPYLISVWGSDVYDFPVKSPIHKQLLKHNLKKADFILSTSEVMKTETKKYTNKDILVTPFGVDINRFCPNKSEKDEIVIGTIKTLEPNYGIEYLVRAFKASKDKNPEKKLKLRIAGKGSQEEYLKNLCKELNIEDDVTFLGFISQDKAIKEFQNFDIAVFPSERESFGVAAVEAEACGVPVIVSDAPGLIESTKPNSTSLVAKKKSAEDLSDKMDILINDDALRERMGKEARQFVIDNFNLEDNFAEVDKLYKKIIMNNKK